MKKLLVVAAMTVLLASTSAYAQRGGIPQPSREPYNRPVPCCLDTGDCVRQTKAQCDVSGGYTVKRCEDCKPLLEREE